MNPRLPQGDVCAFADFIGPIMRLDPDTRPTAAELLRHPWLNKGMVGRAGV
jgi:serine/threonine protein kinase